MTQSLSVEVHNANGLKQKHTAVFGSAAILATDDGLQTLCLRLQTRQQFKHSSNSF